MMDKVREALDWIRDRIEMAQMPGCTKLIRVSMLNEAIRSIDKLTTALTQPQPEAREEDIGRALKAAIDVMREDSPNEAAIDLCESALSRLASHGQGERAHRCCDCDWYDGYEGETCENPDRATCIDHSLFTDIERAALGQSAGDGT